MSDVAAPPTGEAMIIRSGSIDLAAHLARPAPSAAGGDGRQGLVLCHGFPVVNAEAATASGYQELADRLAADTGWSVLSISFRGMAGSKGNFSLAGWLADLKAAVRALGAQPGVEEVWLCGFAAGGALALCAAGEDPSIKGVATFAAPADFGDRANDARRFVAQARATGLIRDPRFPADLEAWGRELRDIQPLSLVAKIPPRPVMIVHGTIDEVVPLLDARALADAADGKAELRILVGASHRLRHDPRAIALLLGWMDRQR